MTPIFVTAIGTGIGKTVVSAILTERLKADYWKPIQSGDLDNSDTQTVKSLVSNPVSRFHPEAYRLTRPFSPHKSADIDAIRIDINKIVKPETDNQLIIEGAGGLMVPLNEKDLMIDLIKKFDAEAVLVIKHYLGSINHTLLSLALLKSYQVRINKIIINGPDDEYSNRAILSYAGKIPMEIIPCAGILDREFIYNQAFSDSEMKRS